MNSFAAIVDRAVNALCDAGFPRDEARQDATVLALHILGWSLADWLSRSRGEASPDFEARFFAWIQRRRLREPVAYILGEKEFYGRPFRVTRETLIPRPETEGLVEAAVEWLQHRHAENAQRTWRVVDVGTGTGCVAITIALESRARGIAVEVASTDISEGALAVARDNAKRLGAAEIDFRLGSLIAGVTPPVDLIASNPPYVALCDRESLQTDVVAFEPATALFGGEDGLEITHALVAEAGRVLSPTGALMLEVGAGQAGRVRTLLEAAGFSGATTQLDLQGLERIVIAHRREASL